MNDDTARMSRPILAALPATEEGVMLAVTLAGLGHRIERLDNPDQLQSLRDRHDPLGILLDLKHPHSEGLQNALKQHRDIAVVVLPASKEFQAEQGQEWIAPADMPAALFSSLRRLALGSKSS